MLKVTFLGPFREATRNAGAVLVDLQGTAYSLYCSKDLHVASKEHCLVWAYLQLVRGDERTHAGSQDSENALERTVCESCEDQTSPAS